MTSPSVPTGELPPLFVRFSKGYGTYKGASDSSGVGRTVVLLGSNPKDNSTTEITSGTVAADYRLTLKPVQAEVAARLFRSFPTDRRAECTGKIQTSDPALQYFEVELMGATRANGLTPLFITNPDGSPSEPHTAYRNGFPNFLLYADRAANVTGTVFCPDNYGGHKESLSLKLNKGWNLIKDMYTPSTPSQPSNYTLESVQPAEITLAPFGYGP